MRSYSWYITPFWLSYSGSSSIAAFPDILASLAAALAALTSSWLFLAELEGGGQMMV
jgi:hypothetical protein